MDTLKHASRETTQEHSNDMVHILGSGSVAASRLAAGRLPFAPERELLATLPVRVRSVRPAAAGQSAKVALASFVLN